MYDVKGMPHTVVIDLLDLFAMYRLVFLLFRAPI